MTGTTANYGFSYPQGTDLVTNGAAAIQTLAEGVDTALFNTPSSYRNLLINGHMQVWQRATDVAGITGFGYYTADRWRWDISTFGTWRHTQDTGAVPANTMFSSSLRMIATTARPSPSSTNSARLQQRVEGQNLQAVMKGKTSAKPLTLSFWGNVPVAGTMIVELEDVTNGRFCSAAVVFSAANSWEYKTVTFPADTTGTWPNTNALALQLNFWLGAGSSFTSGTLGTTWHTTTANRAVGQTNFAATTNWTTYITGVQLEVGSVDTPFEFEPIAATLAKCYRYYYRKTSAGVHGAAYATNAGVFMGFTFPAVMRATPADPPTPTLTNAVEVVGVATYTPTFIARQRIDTQGYSFASAGIAGAFGIGHPCFWKGGDFLFDAEL